MDSCEQHALGIRRVSMHACVEQLHDEPLEIWMRRMCVLATCWMNAGRATHACMHDPMHVPSACMNSGAVHAYARRRALMLSPVQHAETNLQQLYKGHT
eukprot:275731-Chlamydomonas_euryale.AAC.6